MKWTHKHTNFSKIDLMDYQGLLKEEYLVILQAAQDHNSQYAVISAGLQLPLGTVKSRLHRARTALLLHLPLPLREL